jgi:AAHS family 4-hydroxybenzoate transporter-like MFS transporter
MRAMGAGWALGIGRIGSLAGPILGGYLITVGIPRPTLLLLDALPFLACAIALLAMNAAKRAREARRGEMPLAEAGEFVH